MYQLLPSPSPSTAKVSVAHCVAAHSVLRSLTSSDAEPGSGTIVINSEPLEVVIFCSELDFSFSMAVIVFGPLEVIIKRSSLLGKGKLILELLEIFMFRSQLDFTVLTVPMTFGPLNINIKQRLFFR